MGFERVGYIWTLVPILAQGPPRLPFQILGVGPMPALRPTDWKCWKTAARDHIAAAPRADHRGCGREQRLRCLGARAAFALLTAGDHAEARALGAQPCGRCGQWTHSWCEACIPGPGVTPGAICTQCDASHEVCDSCASQGRTWQWGHAQQETAAAQDLIEITGFHDEEGNFIRLETPITIPAEEIFADSRPTAADLSGETARR